MTAQSFHHTAREGYAFQIGNSHIYVGPRESGRGRPILAISRGSEQEVVAEFANATAAEKFIEALKVGIDEAKTLPVKAPVEVQNSDTTTTGGKP